MKLIFESLLIFSLLYLYQAYFSRGYLSKYFCESIFGFPLERNNVTLFIITSYFPKDSTLFFKMTMKYGRFTSDYMNYRETNDLFNMRSSITLGRSTYRDSYSRISWNSSNYYTTETYYYSVAKPSTDYLYIAPPSGDFYYSDERSYIDICCTNKNYRISIWIYVGVGAAGLIVIILSIVFYRCERAQRLKKIDTTVVESIALNTTPATVVAPTTVQPPSPSPYIPNPTYY